MSRPRFIGIPDSVRGSEVRVYNLKGELIRTEPATLWEDIELKNLHYDRLVRDLRYARKNNIPTLQIKEER